MPTGRLAPLLEIQRQRDIPFAIPHFPRWCIYKLQNAACNACSENAKGSLRRYVAQTSFWAEMQKKGKHFLLHSRDPHGGDGRGDEFNIVIGIVERRHIATQGFSLERIRIVPLDLSGGKRYTTIRA